MLGVASESGSMVLNQLRERPDQTLNIGEGLKALQERQFQHRVSISAPDEIGSLAKAFNGVMESLQDLEVAGTLQENFFPKQIGKAGSLDILGSCLPASRVGGDYFDYVPIGDDRFFFLIGDVSGHGVSAALVVAMAKSILIHPSGTLVPEEFLRTLNLVFSRSLKRAKMMSCLAGIFDGKNGAISLANAGHCYPYLVNDDALEIKCPGVLIGTRRPQNPVSVNLNLGDGWWLGYTDGLVEALDRDGRMVGYERLAEALPALKGTTVAETIRNIQSWHAGIAGAGQQEDDITLLVIQKKG